MTAIGEFRHRLAIEAADEVEDGTGGVVRTWAAVAQAWAAVEALSLDDKLFADKRLGVLTHRVILRHRTDLTLSHRLTLGLRIFEIRALRDRDGRGRLLECLVEETHS